MPGKRKTRKRKVAPKRKVGRPPEPILELAGVAAAVGALDGNLAAVARQFGVSRTAVQQFVKNNPELQTIVSDAREGMLDDAESVLFGEVRSGEAWAVCFFLKTQGKGRGYVERQEVDQSATVRLVIDEEVVGGDDPPDGQAVPPAG